MRLFDSKIAAIEYLEDSKLIKTTWKECRHAEDFMTVIQHVMEFYRQVLPTKTLWNQTDFELQISPDLQVWTENNINIPSQKLQIFEKISFVVSKDTMSQMSIMEIFDDSNCGFVPRYFIEENEALAWTEKPVLKNDPEIVRFPQIVVDKVNDKIKLSIEIETEEFDEYLYLFNKLWKARMLSLDFAQKFLTLSEREKLILRFIIKGKSSVKISDILSISPETVRTHRKNIYRKLGCNSITELMKYSVLI